MGGSETASAGQLWLRLPGLIREALYETVIGAGWRVWMKCWKPSEWRCAESVYGHRRAPWYWPGRVLSLAHKSFEDARRASDTKSRLETESFVLDSELPN